DAVPTGNDWLHEYKYDGYRLLVATAGGAATAFTRKGHDWSDKFRSIVRAAAKLPAGCLIDGEAVALDKQGKPSFQLLQATLKGGEADLAFYGFDLLIDQGEDINGLPNLERKERLAALPKAASSPFLCGHPRAEGGIGGSAQGRNIPDPLWRPCGRQGRSAVRRHLQGGRGGYHLQE